MPRDRRVDKLQRLRTERYTRAAGGYYGTRATAYGNVQSRPRRRNMGQTLLSLVLFFAIVGVALYGGGQYIWHGLRPTATAQSRAVTVHITAGETTAQIADDLQSKGLIWNASVFHWYMRLAGIGGAIQAGNHTLQTGMTMDEVVQRLSTAPPAAPTAIVKILPGWRAEQVATALDQAHVAVYADVMNDVARGSFSYPFLNDRPAGAGVEGFLLPDTYLFLLHGGAHYAVGRMLRNFNQSLSAATQAQGKRVYGSFYKAVIMASIVEREAGTPHDRYLIASVYLNRLRDQSGLFKFLGADPTIQYAVNHSPDWWKPISPADLHVNSPYNTRTQRAGLPPGPIAEPSADSIAAAVNPPATPYFYFHHVNGSHHKSIFCSQQQGSQCAGTPQ